jgi:hypothetical protein
MAGEILNKLSNNQQTELENSDFRMVAAINLGPNKLKTFKHAWNHENETEK